MIVFHEKKIEEMSIQELEIRIQLANMMLKWLRSDDPMLQEEQYRPLVEPTQRRVKEEWNRLVVVCREKKTQRDQAEQEFVENVQIGLKPGRLDARKL